MACASPQLIKSRHLPGNHRRSKYTSTLLLIQKHVWVAQSVKRPTSAQVTMSRVVTLSPAKRSLLSAQSSLWILCPHPPSPRSRSLSLSQNKQTSKNTNRITLYTLFSLSLFLLTVSLEMPSCQHVWGHLRLAPEPCPPDALSSTHTVSVGWSLGLLSQL